MTSIVWKGFISFGLVSLPVRLFAAARSSRIEFHEIHRQCGHRLQQQMICTYDHTVVPRKDMALAYEIDDKMIEVEEKDLRALEPPSSTTLEILQFARLEDVDPIYFQTSYFSVPDEAGRHAYGLLTETMERLTVVAVAKITLHRREQTVVIRPYRGGLILHTIYYPDEIQSISGYKRNAVNLKKNEISLSEQFAKQLLKPFDPREFHDEYQARIRELLRNKRKRHVLPLREKRGAPAPVIDIMTALKKSLAANKSQQAGKPAKAPAGRKTA